MAKEKEGRVKSALGGKKKKSDSKKSDKKGGKKHVHKMHISRTDNGKFLVDHEFKQDPGGEMMPGEQHAIEPEDLSQHVQDNMGAPAPMMAGPAGVLPPEAAAGPGGPPAVVPGGPPLPMRGM